MNINMTVGLDGFTDLCVLVLWTKVFFALEGLIASVLDLKAIKGKCHFDFKGEWVLI